MSSAKPIYSFKIGGVGADATQWSWSTDANGDGRILDPLPESLQAKIDVLGAFSSHGGFSIALQPDAYTLALLNSANPFLSADGSVVRLAEYLDATETSIEVTDGTAFAAASAMAPIYFWVGTEECVKVTSRSGTTLTVERAQLGSRARVIPLSWPGAVLWQSWPNITGRRCTLFAEQGDTTIYSGGPPAGVVIGAVPIYQGILGDDEFTDRLTLQVSSVLQQLADQKWQPPRGTRTIVRRLIAADSGNRDNNYTYEPFLVDENVHGDFEWTRAVFFFGDDVWMILPTTRTDQTDGIATYGDNGGDVVPLLVGKGSTTYPEDLWALIVPGQGQGVECEVEYALVIEDAAPDTIIAAMLKSSTTLPDGMNLGLIEGTDYDLQSLRDVLTLSGIGNRVNRTFSVDATTGYYIAPRWAGRTFRDILDKEFLGPLGLAVIVNTAGKLYFISWLPSANTITTIGAADLMGKPGFQRSRTHMVRDVTIRALTLGYAWTLAGGRYGVSENDNTRNVISDVAATVHGAGRTIKYDLQALATPPILDALMTPPTGGRWGELIAIYGRVLPVIPIEVQPTVGSLNPGDYVSLTSPGTPNSTGGRGVAALQCVVLERGYRTSNRSQPLRLLAVGWGDENVENVQRAKWSPAGRVDGIHSAGSTTITILPNAYAPATGGPYTTDAAAFEGECPAGTRLILRSQNLTKRSDNAVEFVSRSGNDITIDTAFETAAVDIALASGDVITLAPYDDQPTAVQTGLLAFGAGGNGQLGAAGDDGRKYP